MGFGHHDHKHHQKVDHESIIFNTDVLFSEWIYFIVFVTYHDNSIIDDVGYQSIFKA